MVWNRGTIWVILLNSTMKNTPMTTITCKYVYRMITITCGSDYHNVQQSLSEIIWNLCWIVLFWTLTIHTGIPFKISAELSCFELLTILYLFHCKTGNVYLVIYYRTCTMYPGTRTGAWNLQESSGACKCITVKTNSPISSSIIIIDIYFFRQ